MGTRWIVGIALVASVAAACGGGTGAHPDGAAGTGATGAAGRGGTMGTAGGGTAGTGSAGAAGTGAAGGATGTAGGGAAGAAGGVAGTGAAGTGASGTTGSDGGAGTAGRDGGPPDAPTDVPRTDSGPPAGPAGALCNESAWCWMAPTPQGNTLRGVWAPSATELWAVGDVGTIIRFDGKTWTRQRTGVLSGLTAVHGTGPNDVWAVGYSGTILHKTGALWLATASGTGSSLYGVWASATDDAWAVGDNVVLHWDGAQWSPKPTPYLDSFRDIWGSGPSDVWITSQGHVFHWNGSAWAQIDAAPHGPLGGRAKADVWAAQLTTVSRYDGVSWSPVAVPFPDVAQYSRVAASPDGDVWTMRTVDFNTQGQKLALLRGGTWTDVSPLPFMSIWPRTSSDTWAVGTDGVIGHYGAQGLNPPLADPHDFRDYLAGFGPDDVWTVGTFGLVNHFTPSGVERGQIPGAQLISAFHAVSDSDMWAVDGSGGVFHGDGHTWTPENIGTTTKPRLQAVWASGPNDVWVGGERLLLHKDATGWKSAMILGNDYIYAIHGWAANDVWVGGSSRILAHWNGTKWTYPDLKVVPVNHNIFGDIGGSGPSDVWLDGDNLHVYRVNQTTNAVESIFAQSGGGTNAYTITHVRGIAPNDLWMLDGTEQDRGLLHWDGVRFTIAELGVRERFRSLWTAPNGDVWIAGGPRVLRHLATP